LKNPLTRSLIPTAALLAFASQVAAQNAQESLEQRVAELEARLAAQNPELSQQGSSNGDTLSNLFKNGRVDYRLGRGLTFSSQDAEDFSINIGGQVQVGYRYSDDDPTSTTNSGFAVRSSRIRFGGNVFSDKVTYFVQMDPSTGADLVDAWAGWQFHENVNLRLGQQKMRSGLQADTSMADTDLEMVNRSIATTAFANQRATGALFEGNAAEGKFNWHAGLMNNGTAGIDGAGVPGNTAALVGLAGPAQANQVGTSEIGWTAGASYSNMEGNSEDWSEGDLAHTGNLHWIAGGTITSANEALANGGDAMTINLFGGLKAGNGFAGQFEYWLRDNDDLNRDDAGFYGQVSYTLKKNEGDKIQWGGVLRYSSADFDGPEATEISGGVNAYYHEHNLKTQLQISSIQFDNAAGTEVSDTTSIDLLFTLVF
jgi:hypothetical protein